MSKQPEPSPKSSTPMSVRIDDAILADATEYADAFEKRHGVKPSLSQLIRVALMDYLARKRPELDPPKRHK